MDNSTTHVLLREVIEADLPIFYEQQLDPDATRMAAFPSRDHDAFMAHWKKIPLDPANILKTIVFNGEVAGNIVSFMQGEEREVGYWLGKQYWGKGIATAALTQFLAHFPTRPLYAHVAKHNHGSIHVLQKCGFTISGEDKFSFTPGEDIEEYVLILR